jgi:hypothetical protein
MKSSGYEHFGKYLLSHLGVMDEPESLDWDFIIRSYVDTTRMTKPGLMYINWVVSNHFGMEAHKVRKVKTNKPSYTTPKHVAMYLAAKLFRYTQYEIRDFYYSVKNRSSVSNAFTKVEGWMQSDKYFREDVEQITNILLRYEQTYKKPITDTIRSFKDVQEPSPKEGNNMLVNRNREVESSD